MKTRLIKIGNSHGVLIPESYIKESGIEKEIELIVEKNQIVIKPVKNTRKDWGNSFKEMTEAEDDTLLDKESLENSSTKWGEKDWSWN